MPCGKKHGAEEVIPEPLEDEVLMRQDQLRELALRAIDVSKRAGVLLLPAAVRSAGDPSLPCACGIILPWASSTSASRSVGMDPPAEC